MPTFIQVNDRRSAILDDIDTERERQDVLHGAQLDMPVTLPNHAYMEHEHVLKQRYDDKKAKGQLAHADIILEELSESLDAEDPAQLRAELIQTAACIVKAIEALEWQVKQGVYHGK